VRDEIGPVIEKLILDLKAGREPVVA